MIHIHIAIKKLWSYIKNLKKDNASIPPLCLDDVTITDSLQKSEIFNNHLKTVFTTEILEDFPNKGPSHHPTIESVAISTEGILKLLNQLNINKASGGINARVLKETSDVIVPILRIIFQFSLNTGNVPNDWKIAKYMTYNMALDANDHVKVICT